MTDLIWGSRFRIHHRVADTYRNGRLLLAGDAAHVHSPAGGQGMNLGIQDAIALADALSSTLAGSDTALDAYSAARRPIAQQVVSLTWPADHPGHPARTPSARPATPRSALASHLPAVRRGLAVAVVGPDLSVNWRCFAPRNNRECAHGD